MSGPTNVAHSHRRAKAALTRMNLQYHNTQPSSPAYDNNQLNDNFDHSDQFKFPTLKSDGSLSDVIAGSPPTHLNYTPPAALSTLGAKMRAQEAAMAGSVDTLADGQYDMVDDLSEMSDNDNDTASLPSTDHHTSEDEGQMTPEDGSVGDVNETNVEADNLIDFGDGSVVDLAKTLTLKQQRTAEENKLLESYLNDDLETPRQSTLRFAEDDDLGDDNNSVKTKTTIHLTVFTEP